MTALPAQQMLSEMRRAIVNAQEAGEAHVVGTGFGIHKLKRRRLDFSNVTPSVMAAMARLIQSVTTVLLMRLLKRGTSVNVYSTTQDRTVVNTQNAPYIVRHVLIATFAIYVKNMP